MANLPAEVRHNPDRGAQLVLSRSITSHLCKILPIENLPRARLIESVIHIQVLAAAVAVHERWLGVHSSALMFLLWLGLVIYGGLKMWTLVALAKYFVSIYQHAHQSSRLNQSVSTSIHTSQVVSVSQFLKYLPAYTPVKSSQSVSFSLHLQGEVSDKFRFVTFCLQFATYLIEFALWTFPDRRYFITQQEINGVSSVSFLNKC